MNSQFIFSSYKAFTTSIVFLAIRGTCIVVWDIQEFSSTHTSHDFAHVNASTINAHQHQHQSPPSLDNDNGSSNHGTTTSNNDNGSDDGDNWGSRTHLRLEPPGIFFSLLTPLTII